jgi:hypothetical protein
VLVSCNSSRTRQFARLHPWRGRFFPLPTAIDGDLSRCANSQPVCSFSVCCPWPPASRQREFRTGWQAHDQVALPSGTGSTARKLTCAVRVTPQSEITPSSRIETWYRSPPASGGERVESGFGRPQGSQRSSHPAAGARVTTCAQRRRVARDPRQVRRGCRASRLSSGGQLRRGSRCSSSPESAQVSFSWQTALHVQIVTLTVTLVRGLSAMKSARRASPTNWQVYQFGSSTAVPRSITAAFDRVQQAQLDRVVSNDARRCIRSGSLTCDSGYVIE